MHPDHATDADVADAQRLSWVAAVATTGPAVVFRKSLRSMTANCTCYEEYRACPAGAESETDANLT